MKRILDREELKGAARLLPAVSYLSGSNFVCVADILMLGGGVLIGDKYHAWKAHDGHSNRVLEIRRSPKMPFSENFSNLRLPS